MAEAGAGSREGVDEGEGGDGVVGEVELFD